MSTLENATPALADPYLVTEHVVQRTAMIGESNAGLSRIFNRMLATTAVACALYGGLKGNEEVLVASAGLAVAHASNSRLSRKREERFKSYRDVATLAIANTHTHPSNDTMKRPTSFDLNEGERGTVGKIAALSYQERAVKYGSIALDFAALSGVSYANDYVATSIVLGLAGVAAAKRGVNHLRSSQKPVEALGQAEFAAFMKFGAELLKHRLPGHSAPVEEPTSTAKTNVNQIEAARLRRVARRSVNPAA